MFICFSLNLQDTLDIGGDEFDVLAACSPSLSSEDSFDVEENPVLSDVESISSLSCTTEYDSDDLSKDVYADDVASDVR